LREQFDITVLFYNPNIIPNEERDRRRAELMKLVKLMNKEGKNCVEVINYKGEKVLLEKRDCEECFMHRLGVTWFMAEEGKFDYFATTLTVSPHKNASMVNEIGEAFSPKYYVSDFKKKDGFRKSVELSQKYGLYRQNYCGCEPKE